ncbi:hypothetical protein [Evansella cellulosilytica]|uniref:DUF2933 domain-containing protein n=1 Tax=Evansella cellulosilytica (strain ATCC 21833 / DSM 2522 / FERM P-1141 / JCM 9156 / N-4) TaxID=649639 RepID=E6TYY1_EVAC2|nr:hypothetical protein [Evansella cellulosilytica]ADU31316.1 hypothetical protein Bcell_3071 [Evansella cellulosilytica DSM 2522]
MDFSYLALLLCPLMLIAMFFIIKSMNSNNNQSQGNNSNVTEMKKNIGKLMEQNEKLVKEIESLKRYR